MQNIPMKNQTYHFAIELELRQYKNNSDQFDRIPLLKLPPFSSCRIGDEKARQFQIILLFLYCLSSRLNRKQERKYYKAKM